MRRRQFLGASAAVATAGGVAAAPPQTQQASGATYRARIAKAQAAMKKFGVKAMVLEPGPAMVYFTGVRWGRSERPFVAVLTGEGEPAYVTPGFEEARTREQVTVGKDIRIWQEDESPYQRVAAILKDRGVASGRVGMEDTVRFFIFDGVRAEAPKLEYVSAKQVLDASGESASESAGKARGKG